MYLYRLKSTPTVAMWPVVAAEPMPLPPPTEKPVAVLASIVDLLEGLCFISSLQGAVSKSGRLLILSWLFGVLAAGITCRTLNQLLPAASANAAIVMTMNDGEYHAWRGCVC